MRKRLVFVLLATITAPFVFLALWFLAFSTVPSLRSDCRHPRYVLWRAGLVSISQNDLRQFFTCTGDPDSLVLGKTLPELIDMFGDLRTSHGLTPSQQYYESEFTGIEHAWLADSWWVIVFHRGRAVRMRLLKG